MTAFSRLLCVVLCCVGFGWVVLCCVVLCCVVLCCVVLCCVVLARGRCHEHIQLRLPLLQERLVLQLLPPRLLVLLPREQRLAEEEGNGRLVEGIVALKARCGERRHSSVGTTRCHGHSLHHGLREHARVHPSNRGCRQSPLGCVHLRPRTPLCGVVLGCSHSRPDAELLVVDPSCASRQHHQTWRPLEFDT